MLTTIRERLAHSSPAVRELLGLAAYWLPPEVRLGKEFSNTRGIIERARRDHNWAREHQRGLLEFVVAKAMATAYYSDRKEYALDASDDIYGRISQFPVLTRAAMVEFRDSMLRVPKSQVDLVSTSGSSGEPAVFYLDKVRGASEWAYVCDAWRYSGYQPEHWRAVMRGQRLGKDGRRVLLSRSTRELYLSPFGLDVESVQSYWRMIDKKRIVYLHGYPSSLAALAKAALENDPSGHRLNVAGLFPVSEPLTNLQEEILRTAFPSAKVLPFYGLSERVAFAEIDPQSGFYSFSATYGYTEVVDSDGRPVEVGDSGRIVSTGLRLTGMPLLRYDTGDVARLEGYTAAGSPIVSALRGKRTQEHLYTRTGSPVSTSALNVHSEAYGPILAFRFVQQRLGEVKILMVLGPSGTKRDADHFAAELELNCGQRIVFMPEVLTSLPDTKNGKSKLVEMQIPEFQQVGDV